MKQLKDLKKGDLLYYFDSRLCVYDKFEISKVECSKYGQTTYFKKDDYEEWFASADLTKTKTTFDENGDVLLYFDKEEFKKETINIFLKKIEEINCM